MEAVGLVSCIQISQKLDFGCIFPATSNLTFTWDSVIPREYANLALSGPARYLVCSNVFSRAKIWCPLKVGLVCFFLLVGSPSWALPAQIERTPVWHKDPHLYWFNSIQPSSDFQQDGDLLHIHFSHFSLVLKLTSPSSDSLKTILRIKGSVNFIYFELNAVFFEINLYSVIYWPKLVAEHKWIYINTIKIQISLCAVWSDNRYVGIDHFTYS